MPRPTDTELIEKAELAERGLKRCRKCREVLPLGTFGVQTRSSDGLQAWCKACINAQNARYEAAEKDRDVDKYLGRKRTERQSWAKRNPEKYAASVRKQNLKKYGLTPELFDEMFAEQSGKCLICEKILDKGSGLRGLHIDHDHGTGAVRALLCGTCNVGLGAFRDRPDLLRAAADYLERFSEG